MRLDVVIQGRLSERWGGWKWENVKLANASCDASSTHLFIRPLNAWCAPHFDSGSNEAASLRDRGSHYRVCREHTRHQAHQCLHPFISVRTPRRWTQGRIDFLSSSFPPQTQQTVQHHLCRVHLVLRLSLMRVRVCVFSIFSYRGADVLGLPGKEVLGHRQAGDHKHSHMLADVTSLTRVCSWEADSDSDLHLRSHPSNINLTTAAQTW